MANRIHFIPGRLDDAATRAIRPVVAVDLGFARKRASCGLARCLPGDRIEDPEKLQFSEVIEKVAETFGATANGVLILEAPLSGAFDGTHRLGNPAPRGDFERPDGQTRYWYCGAGAAICLGAIFFLWELRNVLAERGTGCTIHLFEGFVTAGDKSARGKNQHAREAKRLLNWFLAGRPPFNLTNSGGLRLVSLLQLLGWEKPNCEVPTIIKP